MASMVPQLQHSLVMMRDETVKAPWSATVARSIDAMNLQLLKVRKHSSANGTISTTVEADEVVVHVIRDVHVIVVDGVGLDGERACGDASGNGSVDQAMSDDAEVGVDKCVIERIVGDEDHWAVHDNVNVFSKLFDMAK